MLAGAAFFLQGAGQASLPQLEPAPPTAKHTVTDTIDGVTLQDDYQWLEQLNDPKVKAWAEKQNQRAQKFLDALPERTQLAAQIKKLITSVPPGLQEVEIVGNKIFGLKLDPSKQQPFVVVLDNPEKPESEKTICDPNTIDPSGATALDWFVPSPDGKTLAVSISKNGTEDGDLCFFDVDTGKQLPDIIKHVQFPTGGGSAAWTRDGKAVFYTRYPREGERPAADLHFYQQVYFHRLGTPESEDVYSVGKEFPKIAEVQLQSNADSDYVVATVENGDGGDYETFAYGPDKNWHQLAKFEDGVKKGVLGFGPVFYAISLAEAPRGKLVKFALDASEPKPELVVPAGEGVISDVAVTDNQIVMATLEGGPSGLYAYNLDGSNQKTIPIPPISTVAFLAAGKDLVLTKIGSYTEIANWFKYDAADNQLAPARLNAEAPVSFTDLEVTRDFAVSKDGTKIPLNIVHKRGIALDGSHPTILYGYGGYGLSEVPRARLVFRAWYDRGGIYVDTNLRGGGEYGEEWHKAGYLTKKQNVFDDFAACAQYLIEHKYTSTPKLGMLGGSNGGLLMGAMITQHPGLMKAVVSEVGIYDSVRSELWPNGAFNTTEFGTIKDPDQFKALLAYSPYHHVIDGRKYPAILLTAGLNDGRVAPYNSFKFAARLQAAAAPGNPILLRVNSFGHGGIGSSLDQQVADLTDVFSFFAYQLGAEEGAQNAAAKGD
ncbi:MAG: S9 family peptidase [Verrucomicrobia bacterium]|nr:S9 family peptidase [Verrucomicrobiota bacterium]